MGRQDWNHVPLEFAPCPECGAGYGERHWPSCGAAIGSLGGYGAPPGRSGGDMLGECLRRGWWCAEVPGQGWRPARARDRGAVPDTARYVFWREHGDAALEGAEGTDQGRAPE